MTAQQHIIPEHVPPELVREYDYNDAPEVLVDPHAFSAAQHATAPDIFWNPMDKHHDGRGVWQPIRAEDLRYILSKPEIFSSDNVTGFSTLMGATWRFIPAELDPPTHTQFRQALNPVFSPPAVKKLADKIEMRAEDLIKKVLKDGGCEFVEAFSRPYPVTIVLEMMGLPIEELDTFMAWELDLLHNSDLVQRGKSVRAVYDYLQDLIKERTKRPTGDFVSFVSAMEVGGRKLTDDEKMGIVFLLFLGGLDTVTASLGFHYRHLATHLDQQRLLRGNFSKIPDAIEELVRRYPVANTARFVAQDTEVKGVKMKKGDWVTVSTSLGCLDPKEFKDPLVVDFDRGARHLGFAFGPHFCMGTHLARLEMKIAMEKWLTMVPEFSMKPNGRFECHPGSPSVACMDIVW